MRFVVLVSFSLSDITSCLGGVQSSSCAARQNQMVQYYRILVYTRAETARRRGITNRKAKTPDFVILLWCRCREVKIDRTEVILEILPSLEVLGRRTGCNYEEKRSAPSIV